MVIKMVMEIIFLNNLNKIFSIFIQKKLNYLNDLMHFMHVIIFQIILMLMFYVLYKL